jgi:hypothetical protein
MRKPDRQDACPTEQGYRDFMVGLASSLSIRNDGQPGFRAGSRH